MDAPSERARHPLTGDASTLSDPPAAASWFEHTASTADKRAPFDLPRMVASFVAAPVGAIAGAILLGLPGLALDGALHSYGLTMGFLAVAGAVIGATTLSWGVGHLMGGTASFWHVFGGALAGTCVTVALVVALNSGALRFGTTSVSAAVGASMLGLMVAMPFLGMSLAFEISEYLRAQPGTVVAPSVAVTPRGTPLPGIAAVF